MGELVERHGAGDEARVREALREVSDQVTGGRFVFFGQQTDVVGE